MLYRLRIKNRIICLIQINDYLNQNNCRQVFKKLKINVKSFNIFSASLHMIEFFKNDINYIFETITQDIFLIDLYRYDRRYKIKPYFILYAFNQFKNIY